MAEVGFEFADIDWVFCFRVVTGGYVPAARHVRFNATVIPFRPERNASCPPTAGVRWIRPRGRERWPKATGFELSRQGAMSMIGCAALGYVLRGWVVVAPSGMAIEQACSLAAATLHPDDAGNREGRTEWAAALVGLNDMTVHPAVWVNSEAQAVGVEEAVPGAMVIRLGDPIVQTRKGLGSWRFATDGFFHDHELPQWVHLVVPT